MYSLSIAITVCSSTMCSRFFMRLAFCLNREHTPLSMFPKKSTTYCQIISNRCLLLMEISVRRSKQNMELYTSIFCCCCPQIMSAFTRYSRDGACKNFASFNKSGMRHCSMHSSAFFRDCSSKRESSEFEPPQNPPQKEPAELELRLRGSIFFGFTYVFSFFKEISSRSKRMFSGSNSSSYTLRMRSKIFFHPSRRQPPWARVMAKTVLDASCALAFSPNIITLLS
mmetsp:Transcript_4577/g.17290  ORF Transcript_4577/g.17290 Transcript_4577/m.17290 type:complete len:226 (+) Transcript_4577:4586-5263(+)